MRYWWEWSSWAIAIRTGLIATAGIWFVIGATEYVANVNCDAYERITGNETRREFLTECYVNVGGEWRLLDEQRAAMIAKDAFGK
jgi:hypothetical protein